MRKTITISVSQDMHHYIIKQRGYGTVSEYIRSLIREERRRRSDPVVTPAPAVMPLNERFVLADILEQLERLKAVIESQDRGASRDRFKD